MYAIRSYYDPWDLYEANGVEKPWTAEIVGTLEKVIAENPKHPGAHHFYIHASYNFV